MRFFLFLFSFLFILNSFGQDFTLIDSLKTALRNAGRKQQIFLLNELSWEYAVIDPNKALEYAELARKKCKPNEKEDLATSFNRIGGAYDYMGKYDDARKFYLEAGDLRLQLKDTIGYSNVLNNVGATYYYQGLYNKALEFYVISTKWKERINDYGGLAKLYNNIGLIYRVQKNAPRAIAYFRKSIVNKKKIGDPLGIANSYSNIGIIYINQNTCDSAIFYIQKAYNISLKSNSQFDIVSSMSNLGFAYLCARDYKHADFYFKRTEKALNQLSDHQTLAFTLKGMGESQFYQGNFNAALEYFNRALTIAKEVNRRELLAEIYLFQSKTLEKTGDLTQSLAAYKAHIAIRDSVFSDENKRQLNELDIRYETAKKEQRIDELGALNKLKSEQAKRNKLQRNVLFIVIGAVLVILLLTYLNLRNKKRLNTSLDVKNQEVNSRLKEKEILLREIHHRVKNNLQIINGLLELQESLHGNEAISNVVHEAQGRIKTMSIIHEMLYQTDNLSDIRFSQYAERLMLGIHAGFSQKKWEVKHTIEDSPIAFSIDTVIPLGLILNELVSNAYKYAFQEGKANQIELQITKLSSDEYQLVFKDSGPGLPTVNALNESDSFGLKLVKMLSRQLKGKTVYSYENGAQFTVNFKEITK